MATDDQSKLLGVVVLARHGDRQGFYQDPDTYDASNTAITPLGEAQEFQLGGFIRSLYLNQSSSSYIEGIANSTSLFQQEQVDIRADAGDEGAVIYDSCIALVQGLWPPTPLANTTLANGTTVTSPLGGYQYVPIESVELTDVSLEGWASCNTFNDHTTAFYNSSEFQAMETESAQFLQDLVPYMDGRAVTLENMWNIFDYTNVQSIHNATFAKALPPTYLAQALTLASWHEYNVFSDPSFDGIGNIAFRTMIPSVITAMQRIVNASDPLLYFHSEIAYKPFLSLFNMTGVVADGALPAAIVNYAASVALELRQPASSDEPVVRFNFKNGTNATGYTTYPMRFPGWDGSADTDVPLSLFVNAFQTAAVNTTLDWCKACGQTEARGCAALLAAPTPAVAAGSHDKISSVGAGFLGAGLTVVVFGAMLGVLAFLGFLTFGKKNRAAARPKYAGRDQHMELHSSTHSITKESSVGA